MESSLRYCSESWKYDSQVTDVIILLYAARSGSTYVSQLISALPDVNKVAASLDPANLEKSRGKYEVETHDRALNHLLCESGNPVFGYKANIVDLYCSAYLGFLDHYLDRTTAIILRRRDVVAQAVSLFKARLTGQFSSNQPVLREAKPSDFDYAAILDHKTTIENVYDLHERAIATLGLCAETYFYEDIMSAPLSFMNSVTKSLKLESSPTKTPAVRVKKIADDINDIWIEMFKERSEA